MSSLRTNRLLARTEEGTLAVFTSEGMAAEECGTTRQDQWLVSRERDRVVVVNDRVITILDEQLRFVVDVLWPTAKPPHIGAYADQKLYVIDDQNLFVVDHNGHVNALGAIDWMMLAEAACRFEQRTGRPILRTHTLGEFTEDNLPDVVRDAFHRPPDHVGLDASRRMSLRWHMSIDPDAQRVFVTSYPAPHFVACFTFDGQLRWCEALSTSCCGGPVVRAGESYACSSGCAGFVTWFDGDGTIYARSKPNVSGMRGILSARLATAPDGRVFVERDPGMLAFNASGEILWESGNDCGVFQYDHRRGLLLCTASERRWGRQANFLIALMV